MSVTLRLIWRTQQDSQVCHTCRALEGYTWILKAGESYPKKLIHPTFGPVYDTRISSGGSLVKEDEGRLCRCTISEQFDVSNLLLANNKNEEAYATAQNVDKKKRRKSLKTKAK